MHYPAMSERQVAARWRISLKTLRREPRRRRARWHKLFHHVRYHEADILEFERQSAQHWMTRPVAAGRRFLSAVSADDLHFLDTH